MRARPISAVAALAFSVAFLAFVLAGLMAVQPPSYETRNERMHHIPHDKPLLTREQKGWGQETGIIRFEDANGNEEAYTWDYFLDNYNQYLFVE